MFFLILLDLFWAGAALWVDIPKLMQIPVWSWLLVVICPIYPFLLALIWIQIKSGKQANSYLLAFGAIGSAVFGPLALIFYPALIVERGWGWNEFGQIFWVSFYSTQGWYLIAKRKFELIPVLVAGVYFLIKIFFDYKTKTMSYLDFADLSYAKQNLILAVALISLSLALLFAMRSKLLRLCRNRRQGRSG
ncbi:MAG: hypothetical protein OEV37_00495 [Candidatus Berkelbacteria bacterium]|nr:hypothetical protein [Candidatus Berkelbacteria bacterium]